MFFTNLLSVAVLALARGAQAAAPGPVQAGQPSNCSKWTLIHSGDTCSSIATANGISLSTFLAWNPAAGSDCSGLWSGYYACVGTGATGDPNTPVGPAVPATPAKPSPTQSGIPSSCKKWHLVASGDTCASIASSQGISLANFYSWNPAVGSTCASLWLGYWVCVSN
ncbi:hypothetical protein L873DRAFT_1816021 [Choiromyces venosus 120613-1]|uniref:LysM domain-containing protein n=1 Tax=Choiromyces venosus 120613-1 TaxID=1336337 RepID=A0A3N4JHM6_9PEZI|nr:hypothetical protein L873DRAFT_1816021 [Choiromyces venosus 120613-1]